MFRDTPVSPYLDSNADNEATRPALIHLWVNHLFSFQRKILAPSPNIALKTCKGEWNMLLLGKTLETGIKLEIMLAAYTIQLELTPCLSSSTGRVGVFASRITTVQTSCVNIMACKNTAMSQKTLSSLTRQVTVEFLELSDC